MTNERLYPLRPEATFTADRDDQRVIVYDDRGQLVDIFDACDLEALAVACVEQRQREQAQRLKL